jgi:hypothetical protein
VGWGESLASWEYARKQGGGAVIAVDIPVFIFAFVL